VHLAERVETESAPVVYFELDDLDRRVMELQAAGLMFESEPSDQPWLWREAYIRDPAGNLLCLYSAGANRLFPPWRLTE
jgi:hydroxymethylpyrimidine/phosphomethylpyrimidine kinase